MKFTYASGSRPLDGYTIKRGVGHGGFGEVYYAVSDGGKEVALKLVLRNLDVELRGVAQCMNLKHPNLVTLYDLRTNDAGEHWVVMEYVAGKCLSQLLEEQPNGFSLDDVNRWLKGIAAGIGYLHDKGIVHRDLKPGNLFLEDGVVKVGDYGLSKFITASRRSGQTESVGTVHYMAPEISRGRYDREIDVYATGIMLYEMITGHVPFDGESVGEILMKHLTALPDVSRLPSPYNLVAQKALAKDPADRFRTMEEFAASLNGRLDPSLPFASLKQTIPFIPPDAPGDAAASPPLGEPARAFSPALTVPFRIDVYGGFAEAHGMLRFGGQSLALQFHVKDAVFGAVKSGLKDVQIPVHEISSMRLRRHLFSTSLILHCTNLNALDTIPTRWPGRVKLRVSRDDREVAQRLVDAVTRVLHGAPHSPARERAEPAAAAARPAARNEGVHAEFERARTKIVAWYERPWTLRDYFLAILCMVAVAIAGTAAMGGFIALAPGAIVVLGIALIVMKLSGRRLSKVAAASPVVLSPMHADASPVRPAPVAAAGPPAPAPPPAPVRSVPVLRPATPREPLPKPARTRLAEATSAMLLSAVLSVIASVIAAGIMRLHKLEECALLTATTLAGCWAVIVPAKFWEGRAGDAVTRRLVMAALGLGVGMGSMYLDGLMQVGWLNDPKTAPLLFESLEWMPKVLMHASYFGLVFMIPRWWLLADSRRGVRFNPWLAIVPCFWAWMIMLLWQRRFDNPSLDGTTMYWGVVVVGLVATLVQMACRWDDPVSRRKVA